MTTAGRGTLAPGNPEAGAGRTAVPGNLSGANCPDRREAIRGLSAPELLGWWWALHQRDREALVIGRVVGGGEIHCCHERARALGVTLPSGGGEI